MPVDASHFATLVQEPITIDVSQTIRLDFSLQLSTVKSTVNVSADAVPVDTSTNTLGANDLAQNPFDLEAEHGPSLFDACHRAVASGTWQPRIGRSAPALVRRIFGNWELNVIATHNSPTPFTVYDSTNVSLQANSPPISGYPASRPNLIGNPNNGPETAQQWLTTTAFQRLNPITQAGQFGNEGRDVERGPAFTDVDASIARQFAITEATRIQFRAESFNIANHTNLGLPVADLNSPNFGQILSSGPSRLMQFALKLTF